MKLNWNILTLILLFAGNGSLFATTLRSLEEVRNVIKIGDEQVAEVRSIDLTNRGLSEFPTEILQFKNLESLNLSDNGIVNIPLEFGELSLLEELNFSGNQGLSYVDLEDVLEVATFKLEQLNLANCELGFIPHQIGRQRQIVELDLSGNLLNNLPYPVTQLGKLEAVNVSNNQLTDLSWQASHWWKLKSLNAKGNKGLDHDKLIRVLSAKDGLKTLKLSHISSLPKAFNLLNLKELEIAYSNIPSLPRYPTSSPIERLTFESCTFGDAENAVETINKYVKPRFMALHNMPEADFNQFLLLQTDSVSLRGNQLSDIRVLAAVRQLKYVDLRSNPVSKKSINYMAENRPDLSLMYSDPVEKNQGVNPPFPELAPQPTYTNIKSSQSSQVTMGSTAFSIPKDAFITENGQLYTGNVELAYTEYMNPTAVFLSGITMTSDSASENLMFSSAGMFEIQAQGENGEKLEMNPQNPVSVEMLSIDPDPGMNVYQLSAEGNWEYKGKDSINEPFKVDMAKVDSAANNAFLNYVRNDIIVTEDRFLPVLKGYGKKRTFQIQFEQFYTNVDYQKIQKSERQLFIKRPNQSGSLIAQTTLLYDGPMDSVRHYRQWLNDLRRDAQRKYKVFKKESKKNNYEWGVNLISNLELNPRNNEDRLYLSFKYKDSLVQLPVVLDSKVENPKQRVSVFKRFFKSYNRLKFKDEQEKRKLSRMAEIQVKKEEQGLRNLAREREVIRQKMIHARREEFSKMADISSVKRSFALTGFGVWNCDQRSRMQEPEAIPREFVLSTNETIIDTTSTITIVDYDMNGVLTFTENNAYFDKASGKTAIIVFLSATVVGVWKSWKDRRNNGNSRKKQLNLEVVDIEGKNVEFMYDFIGE